MIPALIGAGASLLGAIFGSGSKKQTTTTTSYVDYKRMVRDAEAAGFNPLTAIRNGGSAGFSVTTSTTPAAPLSARLADGLASGVNTFLQNFDPHADAMREKGAALIDAQIRNLNAQSGAIFPPAPGGFHMPAFERRPSGQAVVLRTGAGPNGEILPIFTDWRDRDGNIVQLPNPQLPESEQFMVPVLGKAENNLFRPIESHLHDNGWIKSRPLTREERDALDEGWLPSWVPRVRFAN